KGTPSPLKPRSDEVQPAEEEKPKPPEKHEPKPPDVTQSEPKDEPPAAEKKEDTDSDQKKDTDKATDEKKDAKKKHVVVKVDFDGLGDRLIGLPVKPANYGNIHMLGEKVYYVRVSSASDDDDDEANAGKPHGTPCM